MLAFHNTYRALTALTFLFFVSTSLCAADYFWVGGSGNWSDISNWATTSGGATTHAQAPTSNDDVFFDANSFNGAMDVLLFNEGTLRTSGRAVTTGFFRSDGDAVRTLDLGASTVTITANTWRPFSTAFSTLNSQPLWIDARNLTLTSGTSTIVLTGTQVDFFLEGPGTLAFNELIFSAPSGNSTIRQWTNQNGLGTEPVVSFARLNLLHGILLAGGFTADELELHGGQEYQFQGGETFLVNSLIATGDCSRTVGMVGTEAGNPAIFSSAAAITTDFISRSGADRYRERRQCQRPQHGLVRSNEQPCIHGAGEPSRSACWLPHLYRKHGPHL